MDDRVEAAAGAAPGHSCLPCACRRRVGHNEIIGVMRVGCNAEGLGRDHWNEMLAYPRKPVAHWHPLLEPKKSEKEVGLWGGGRTCRSPASRCLRQWKARTASFDSQGSCPSPRPPASP